jgi:hypothetical protein
MGEPLATLPPSVPALRTGRPAKRAAKDLQLRAAAHQGGEGVRQAHGGADGGVVGRLVDAAQLGHARHVQHLGELAVLLGHPQAHVGAAGHELGLRVRGARRQQLGQRGGGFVRKIGLQRLLALR